MSSVSGHVGLRRTMEKTCDSILHARAPGLGRHVRIADVPESPDRALLANDLSPVDCLEDAGGLH